ncbi:MAG: metallophosphoesterase family protein [Planctomycetes bacterium]|nr:metallophosphoesterase family protein [Planctomycetota bacterium]
MLYAILGDIHGNLHALEAVLDKLDHSDLDRVLCVGDVVGYGAYPNKCIQIVQQLDALTVAGNHDWATIGKIRVDYFNADARDSILWTREALDQEGEQYIRSKELVASLNGITLVHSTLFSPEYFDYMQTLYDARLSFDRLQTGLCFCGHSHVPVMFLDNNPVDCFLEPEFEVPEDRRLIVNVGSVGQPRDLDPRACYVLYDDEARTISMRRVEYDVHAASQSILDAGLPATNAARLMLGR